MVMSRRLPPLNALRAFEAAARHLSFSRAAAELNVTPAAISHQIKQLEESLQVQLFRRRTRSILLTEAGQACLPPMRDGFDLLARGVEAALSHGASGVLSVTAAPSFASKWLVPRLEQFAEAHPDISVRISAGMGLADFRADDIDVGVRFGAGDYPGLLAHKIFDEESTPLCSPALLARGEPLHDPSDLRRFTLIHDDSGPRNPMALDWATWLRTAGADGVDPTRGLRFDHADHALQAAIDGAGVVLGRMSLAARDIAEGRLVRPFDLTIPLGFAYYVVYPAANDGVPKVQLFRDWVLETARADMDGA